MYSVVKYIKKAGSLCCICLALYSTLGYRAQAQNGPVQFNHVSSQELLGVGNFGHALIDKSGIFWIASTDGIISYDGYNVQHYAMETHPVMESNVIGYISCDSRNRIWVSNGRSPLMIDEQRNIHKIHIPGYRFSEQSDRAIFEKPGGGYIAITYDQCFNSPDGLQEWKADSLMSAIIGNQGLSDIKQVGKETLLCVVRNQKIMMINFAKNKITLNLPLKNVRAAAMLNEKEIIAGCESSWQLYRINIATQKIVDSFAAPRLASGQRISTGIRNIEPATDGSFYIATQSQGLIHLTPHTGKYLFYNHHFANPKSISSNESRDLSIAPNGRLLLTNSAGIDFTNLNYPMFNSIEYLQNQHGDFVRPNTNMVFPMGNQQFLLLGKSDAYLWQQGKPNVKTFAPAPTLPNNAPAIAYAAFEDYRGNLWIGYQDDGIRIYNKQGKLLKHLKNSLPHPSVRCFEKAQGTGLWVGSTNGLYLIDTKTYQVDTFLNRPALKPLLHHHRVIDLLTHNQHLWIATSPSGALYRYHLQKDQLLKIDTSRGLISNRIYSIAADKLGQIYAGTLHGISVISPDGSIYNYNKNNGLPSNRIESMIADAQGNIWFAATKKIGMYNPVQKNFLVFDHRNGIGNLLFNVVAATATPDGTLFFPASSGAIYFNPAHIKHYSEPQGLQIFFNTGEGNFRQLLADSSLQFEYNKGKISFQVSGTDAGDNGLLYYRFKMMGFDTGWSPATRNRTIAYNLRPGKYCFAAEGSFDKVNYFGANTIVQIVVKKPWWQQWWFLLSCTLLLLFTGTFIYKQRIKTLEKKALLQQQLAELEGKALRAQMNPHFIFNSLNAIQECVISGNVEAAYDYLARFSKLLRMVLNNSEKNLVPLQDEIEMLDIYLKLEALRFKNNFSYQIIVNENVEPEICMVPPLLLQPFVENAIWHGLLHKDGNKKLEIKCSEENGKLSCIISDNGIGRKKSAQIKAAKLGSGHFESKGMQLSKQRLSLLNIQHKEAYSVTINDLYMPNGQPAGTQVTIYFNQLENTA